ncbi:conserved hypothetical protein [uncultured spirochete]|jgi:hypothetical protein|uniref:DUF6788 domain-containing protein n=2 Tax=Spirochaetales TaxID=136 RepID=A0A3P3XFF5_9SPIR|nr:conserved hypothetical protein [uncultured spirochete]
MRISRILIWYRMESVIQALLYEEKMLHNRLQRLENECASRPKGSIILKRRFHMVYAYLQWREGEKVVSRYLGKSDSWKCRSMQAKIIERRKYEQEMREVQNKLKKIHHLLEEAKKLG